MPLLKGQRQQSKHQADSDEHVEFNRRGIVRRLMIVVCIGCTLAQFASLKDSVKYNKSLLDLFEHYSRETTAEIASATGYSRASMSHGNGSYY